MIRLQPISTSDLQHYKFMEELLIDSFPPEEYRQLEQLREYTDRTGKQRFAWADSWRRSENRRHFA